MTDIDPSIVNDWSESPWNLPKRFARLTSHQKQAIVTAVVLVGFILFAVAFWLLQPKPRLSIDVINESGSPISDVRFTYFEGKGLFTVEEIKPGATASCQMLGNSPGFEIVYRLPDQPVITRKYRGSFDSSMHGRMFVHLRPTSMKVEVEDLSE